MFFDNCVWLGNYALFCELVYFCRGWQRSNVREPFCARYYSRGFFVYAIGTSRAWLSGVTLISDFRQDGCVDGYLHSFFVLLCARTQRTWRAHNSK